MKIDNSKLTNSINLITHNRSLLESNSKKQKSWQKKIDKAVQNIFLPFDADLNITAHKEYSRPLGLIYRWSKKSELVPKFLRVAMGNIFSFTPLLKKSIEVSINNTDLSLSKKEANALIRKVNSGTLLVDTTDSFMYRWENETKTMRIRISNTLYNQEQDVFEDYDQQLIEEIKNKFEDLKHVIIEYPDNEEISESKVKKLKIFKDVEKECDNSHIDIGIDKFKY